MRLIHVICCVAVAAAPALGCAKENDEAASAKAALSQERAVAGVQDRARSLLLASEVQLKDLRSSRDEITDSRRRDAISNQIVDLAMSRDQLMGDMAASAGGPDMRSLERDMANLQRAMHGTGAAETQPQPEPQTEPQPQQQPQQGR
jgi:hypothetical protein